MKETPTESVFDLVEAKPDERQALRRALRLECALVSHTFDVPVDYVAVDVSPHGMWIDTYFPLHPGSEVVLSFTPPGGEELTVFAEVKRAVTGRRRGDRGPLGMAVAFTDATAAETEELGRCLRGIPPRLKRRRALN